MFARCPETYKPLEPGQTTTYNGNPLLPGWEDSVTHCVVMAGARASGKSLYLAVLIKQLELMALQRFTRVTIKAADESTRQRYKENYERPLYEEMKHMAKKSVQDNKWKSIMANEGAAFSRDTGWSYQYHNQWILHLEIQSLLRKFEAHELLNTIEELYANEPSKYSYFAVSALGEAPKGQDVDRKGIAPYRVLDPVRWHLGRFGVLMGKEDTYQ